jgi:hypothetical protein
MQEQAASLVQAVSVFKLDGPPRQAATALRQTSPVHYHAPEVAPL